MIWAKWENADGLRFRMPFDSHASAIIFRGRSPSRVETATAYRARTRDATIRRRNQEIAKLRRRVGDLEEHLAAWRRRALAAVDKTAIKTWMRHG